MKYFRLIPFIILMLAIAVLWVEPWAGILSIMYLRYVMVLMAAWALLILIRSSKHEKAYRKAYWLLACADIAALGLFAAIRVPSYGCDAEEMEKHYLASASQFTELTGAVGAVLGKEYNLTMELKSGKADEFYLRRSSLFNSPVLYGNDANRDSLLHACGIVPDGFAHLEKCIRDVGCGSIQTHLPDYIELKYRVVAMTEYSYRLYMKPMTKRQREDAMADPRSIPYNDHVVFLHYGGSAGADGFAPEEKDEMLNRIL